MRLGELQHVVMLAVARLGDSAYGGAIQNELAEVDDRRVAVGTIYVTLVRLEDHGLVSSSEKRNESGSAGRPRRVFELTEEGWAALRAARQSIERMWDGVEPA